MEATEFSSAYFERMDALESQHAWTRAMRTLTLALLQAHARQPFGRVLDVGCGTGQMLREWLHSGRARTGVGIDLYPEALVHASRRLAGCWVAASAAALPFKSQSFDAVHCADVLQHLSLSESDRALDLFAELLRPGGWLALRVRGRRLLHNTPDSDYSHAFTAARLRSELGARSFRIAFVSRVNALPSLWAELSEPSASSATGAAPVKGIALRDPQELRSKLIGAYLACERAWLLRTGIPLGFGHTLICAARRI